MHSLGSKYVSAFTWRLLTRFVSLKFLRYIRLLKSVISLKYFTSFNSSKILLNIYIIKPFDLLNTYFIARTKTLVKNLLMNEF